MDKSKLLRHVFGTYNWLRYGMAVIAFAFPWLLWEWGKLHGFVIARLHERVLLGIYRRRSPGAGLVRWV